MNPLETKEEPEAAALRNVLRTIKALVSRTKESGDWKLTDDDALRQIDEHAKRALDRKRTNGEAIDELEEKVIESNSKLFDAEFDRQQLRIRVTQLEAQVKAFAEAAREAEAMRPLLATGLAGADVVGGSVADFLDEMSQALHFLVEYQVPPKAEIAKVWLTRIGVIARAIRTATPDGNKPERQGA